jgi:hypothetical protein
MHPQRNKNMTKNRIFHPYFSYSIFFLIKMYDDFSEGEKIRETLAQTPLNCTTHTEQLGFLQPPNPSPCSASSSSPETHKCINAFSGGSRLSLLNIYYSAEKFRHF